MQPRIRWGLIVGGIVALLNLCAGALVGFLTCCVTVLAGAAAGYLGAKDEPAGKGAESGAVAGGIAGAIGLVGQLIGWAIGSVLVSPYLSTALESMLGSTNPIGAGTYGGAFFINLCSGLFTVLVSAGVGALVGMLTGPKVPPGYTPPAYTPPSM